LNLELALVEQTTFLKVYKRQETFGFVHEIAMLSTIVLDLEASY